MTRERKTFKKYLNSNWVRDGKEFKITNFKRSL